MTTQTIDEATIEVFLDAATELNSPALLTNNAIAEIAACARRAGEIDASQFDRNDAPDVNAFGWARHRYLTQKVGGVPIAAMSGRPGRVWATLFAGGMPASLATRLLYDGDLHHLWDLVKDVVENNYDAQFAETIDRLFIKISK